MLTKQQRHDFIHGHIDAAVQYGVVNANGDTCEGRALPDAERSQLSLNAVMTLTASARRFLANPIVVACLEVLAMPFSVDHKEPTFTSMREAGEAFWISRQGVSSNEHPADSFRNHRGLGWGWDHPVSHASRCLDNLAQDSGAEYLILDSDTGKIEIE